MQLQLRGSRARAQPATAWLAKPSPVQQPGGRKAGYAAANDSHTPPLHCLGLRKAAEWRNGPAEERRSERCFALCWWHHTSRFQAVLPGLDYQLQSPMRRMEWEYMRCCALERSSCGAGFLWCLLDASSLASFLSGHRSVGKPCCSALAPARCGHLRPHTSRSHGGLHGARRQPQAAELRKRNVHGRQAPHTPWWWRWACLVGDGGRCS